MSLPNGTLVNVGYTIQPSQHNPAMEDIASQITGSLSRDGLGGMRANLGMGGYAIENVSGISASGNITTAGTVTGGALSGNTVQAAAGVNGRVLLTSPSGINTGRIDFTDGSGGRRSYIGFQSLAGGPQPLFFHNDSGGGYYFDSGAIISQDGFSWNGQSVYYPGNIAGIFASGANGNGVWRRGPDGYLEQMGEVTLPATSGTGSGVTITFPTPFAGGAFIQISLTPLGAPSGSWAGIAVRCDGAPSTTQQVIYGDTCDSAAGARFFNSVVVRWRAVGTA